MFSGRTFKPESVVNNAVDKFGIPNCGRNQVCAKKHFKILDSKLNTFIYYQGRPQEPEFCTCEDGSTFDLVTVQIGQV